MCALPAEPAGLAGEGGREGDGGGGQQGRTCRFPWECALAPGPGRSSAAGGGGGSRGAPVGFSGNAPCPGPASCGAQVSPTHPGSGQWWHLHQEVLRVPKNMPLPSPQPRRSLSPPLPPGPPLPMEEAARVRARSPSGTAFPMGPLIHAALCRRSPPLPQPLLRPSPPCLAPLPGKAKQPR